MKISSVFFFLERRATRGIEDLSLSLYGSAHDREEILIGNLAEKSVQIRVDKNRENRGGKIFSCALREFFFIQAHCVDVNLGRKKKHTHTTLFISAPSAI